MMLGAYAEATIAPRVAPLFERWTSLTPETSAESISQRGRARRA